MTAAGDGGRVDGRQVAALIKAAVKCDLRTSRAGYRSRRVSPFVLSLVVYAMMGTFLSLALLASRDPFMISLFTLSAALFMTVLSIVMDYGIVVVSPEDYDVIAFRPVSSRTYFWAKMGNLLFYTGATVAALAGPTAVIGSFTLPGGVLFGIAYFALALLACAAAAAFVVFAYAAALRVVSYGRLTSAMTYVHAGATVVLTLGYVFLPQFIGRDASALTVQRGAWMYWAPPAWFAGGAELLSGAGVRGDGTMLALALLSSAVAFAAASRTVSLDYSRRISELAAQAPPTETGRGRMALAAAWISGLGLRLCRNDVERAGFDLMRAYMTRDRKLRSRVYPAFGLPLAAYLYGVLSGSFGAPKPGVERMDVLTILGLYCVFVSFFFTSAMGMSEHWRAAWVFHAAPIERRPGLLVGARKFVLSAYILPFLGVLFALLALVMPLRAMAPYWALVALSSLLGFALLSLGAPHHPLSQSVERTSRTAQVGLIVVFGGLVVVIAVARRVMMETPGAAAIVLAAFAAAALAAEAALRVRMERRLAKEEFGD
jgi:hypothetical protein